MAGLFDMPLTRTSKGADSRVVKKSTTRKSAPITVRGGGLLTQIASINALVEKKLGKYRDDYDFYMSDDINKFHDYITAIINNGICAFDTETTGLDPISDTFVGISFYTPNQRGCYIPLNHISYVTGILVDGQIKMSALTEELQRLVSNNVKFVTYNGKFDRRVVGSATGVWLPIYYDCHLAAMLLNENEQHGLKRLHSKYVLDGKEDEFSFGKLFDNITFDKVPIKTGYIYAARDSVDTYELYEWQLPYLTKGNALCKEYGLEKVSDVFWNIEMPCLPVLAQMEQNGINLDLKYADELSKKYHKQEEECLKKFYSTCDMYKSEIAQYRAEHPNNKLSDPINIASPVQLSILLYDIMKLDAGEDKKTGKKIRGTGDDILASLDNPVCEAIRNYRTVEKLLTTYIDKLPQCINPKDGKLHCNYNQYGAKTGRMSSDNPNLQNIPSHNHDIRKMFVAAPGNVLLSSDYSQQEPKVMTVMCQDPAMIKAYQEGRDLYASIASLAFNKPYEQCLEFNPDGTTNPEGKERRSQAKTILLGILYGRGINSVAEQLHTTKNKAQQIQDKIFKGFPAIEKFEKDTIAMAKDLGYVTTFWGRKRRLPEMLLPEFEFSWKAGHGDFDPLSFDEDSIETEVPWDIQKRYITKLHRNPYRKGKIYAEADAEGIKIIDNGGKIADATRQCVNSRIQGSAADLTKLAAVEIYKNERLKELGFKLLIPVHDEFIAECPLENAKECAELFSKCMSDAARDMNIPISTDVTISREWYGEEIKL